MTPLERLDVYREQYWFRHWASLAEDFPTVAWLLGGRASFDALATAYLTAVPPATWDLQRLGEGLPRYLATTTPWSERAALVDAALLDWAYVRAFDAPDAAPFDVRTLANAPDDAMPRATLSFHPALQLLALDHSVQATRRDLVLDGDPAAPSETRSFVAVWRDDACRLRDADVEPEAFQLWTALSEGRPLGEACEAVARTLVPQAAEAFEQKVAQWFQDWTTRGWITHVAL
jgi:hypothetical protein